MSAEIQLELVILSSELSSSTQNSAPQLRIELLKWLLYAPCSILNPTNPPMTIAGPKKENQKHKLQLGQKLFVWRRKKILSGKSGKNYLCNKLHFGIFLRISQWAAFAKQIITFLLHQLKYRKNLNIGHVWKSEISLHFSRRGGGGGSTSSVHRLSYHGACAIRGPCFRFFLQFFF